MTKLVLEISDRQDLELILTFAKRLKANVIQISGNDEKSPIYWLEKLSENQSFKDIKDPIEWQKKIRKDRKLPFRD